MARPCPRHIRKRWRARARGMPIGCCGITAAAAAAAYPRRRRLECTVEPNPLGTASACSAPDAAVVPADDRDDAVPQRARPRIPSHRHTHRHAIDDACHHTSASSCTAAATAATAATTTTTREPTAVAVCSTRAPDRVAHVARRTTLHRDGSTADDARARARCVTTPFFVPLRLMCPSLPRLSPRRRCVCSRWTGSLAQVSGTSARTTLRSRPTHQRHAGTSRTSSARAAAHITRLSGASASRRGVSQPSSPSASGSLGYIEGTCGSAARASARCRRGYVTTAPQLCARVATSTPTARTGPKISLLLATCELAYATS